MSDVDVMLKSYEEFCAQLLPMIDYRHQLYRRLQDTVGSPGPRTWWMYREASRFVHLQYEPLLPDDEDWNQSIVQSLKFLETFPHRSKSDPQLISWTPSIDYGLADKRVIGKVGRYLSTQFRFEPPVVADFVNRANTEAKPLELRFADTVESITYAYGIGPNSCMSKRFAPTVNPLAAYCCPQLKLAYLYQAAMGRVVARTIVRVDRTPHEYTRIYGNEFALTKALRALGYVFAADGLEGVTLGSPKYDVAAGRIYLPYIDLPHQCGLMDFERGTITICRSNTPFDRSKQMILAITSAEGAVKLAPGYINAWVAKDLSVFSIPPSSLKRRSNPHNRFWGGFSFADEDEIDILCSYCEDAFNPEDLSVDCDGQAVCEGCVNERYVWARNSDGADVLVNSNDDRLTYVACLGEHCFDCAPDGAFDVVEDIDGEWIRSSDAVWSEVQESYLHIEYATEVTLRDGGRNTTSYVSEAWLELNIERLLFEWYSWRNQPFPQDYPNVFVIHERDSINEQKQALLAEAEGNDRETTEAQRLHTFNEFTSSLVDAIQAHRDFGTDPSSITNHALRYVPAYIQANVRARLAELAAFAPAARRSTAVR